MSDQHYIRVALAEAELGLGQTSPNPSVGAVIVCNGEIIAKGFHAKAGTPHAERVVISVAEQRGFNQWAEATLYVTLEPCSTHGTTGACTTAIIEKGFQRVVYGSVDPNPAHEGHGDQVLKVAGIEVKSRVLEDECDYLIRGFRKAQIDQQPWVIIKSAMGLDGKITRPEGEGQWLTSVESRHEVHQIRAVVDAVITGGNTVRADNPSLTVRLPDRDSDLRQPKRVILTRDPEALPKESKLMEDAKTLVFQTMNGDDLKKALSTLVKDHGVNTVLVEAGGELIGAFCDAGLVDEVVIFYAPMVTGGRQQSIAGEGAAQLPDAMKLENIQFTKIGNDVMLRGIVKK